MGQAIQTATIISTSIIEIHGTDGQERNGLCATLLLCILSPYNRSF